MGELETKRGRQSRYAQAASRSAGALVGPLSLCTALPLTLAPKRQILREKC